MTEISGVAHRRRPARRGAHARQARLGRARRSIRLAAAASRPSSLARRLRGGRGAVGRADGYLPHFVVVPADEALSRASFFGLCFGREQVHASAPARAGTSERARGVRDPASGAGGSRGRSSTSSGRSRVHQAGAARLRPGSPFPAREEMREDWAEFLGDDGAMILVAERRRIDRRLRRLRTRPTTDGVLHPRGRRRRSPGRARRRDRARHWRRARASPRAPRRLRERSMLDWRIDEPARVALLAEARLPSRRSSGCTGTSSRGVTRASRCRRARGSPFVTVPGRRARAAPAAAAARRSRTSARPCATRCGSRSRARRSRRWSRAAAGRRSSSSRRRCRFRARRTTRGRRRSRRRSTSSSGSACRSSGRRSSSPAGLGRRAGPTRARGASSRPELAPALPWARSRSTTRRTSLVDARRRRGRRRCGSIGCSSSTDLVVAGHRGGDGAPRRPRRAARGAPSPEALRGAAAVLAARDRGVARLAPRPSPSSARSAERVPVIGVVARARPAAADGALPRLPVRGRVARAARALAAAPALGCCPSAARGACSTRSAAELTAAAAFAGPPSVAHAEALLRAIDAPLGRLDEPLDAIVIGDAVRSTITPARAAEPDPGRVPRARPRAAALARRVPGARTAARRSSLHRFHRHFAHRDAGAVPRALPACDTAREPDGARGRPSGRRRSTRGRSAPTARGRAVPPAPAVRGLGSVPAGARPARLGRSSPAAATPPPRGSSASSRRTASAPALEMAHGRADGQAPRVGFLLVPAVLPAPSVGVGHVRSR